ncbi:drug/metabolite transporter (DMT)-like permease [Microbacterium resistens]|uniref:Drug/metabolite transporter (DMT)-like permease n=1 Tax=Microbacterium resistens TaxID=156977 RepID=A0ABU1SJ06_9MICO|nr:EamA family transporter [Microbacterium resistens]MDR6868988.1 drug/metabolite transporter (DMT)-like permease [Microbacterium resistens]
MNPSGGFTRRGWLLFGAMALLWGVPYLFISVAVESFSPPAVVAGRTLIAALLLLPFAIRSGALRKALRHWPWILAFGLVEMGGPFLLLGHAEQTLPSGLTGLLVATVPLFAALIALSGGDRGVLKPARVIGLLVGFAGVAIVVVGPGLTGGEVNLLAAGEVLLVAVLYATAPFIVARKLGDVPSLGTITLALLMIGTLYLPIAAVTQHRMPTLESVGALLALAVISTAIAFLAFFALIREVGPVRAPLFTYVNPVVAILLGALVLTEPLTVWLLIGFPVIIAGCWFAGTGGRLRPARATVPPAPVEAVTPPGGATPAG